MGRGVYATAAVAKADIYSAHWGRLDSWWSVGKVGIFALVAFWARDDEIVSYRGKWSKPWLKDQKLKRGFALGRAGDLDGGLGAAARRLGVRVGVDPSKGIKGGDAASSSHGMTCTGAVSLLSILFPHRRGRRGLRPRARHGRRRRSGAGGADAPGGARGAARDACRQRARRRSRLVPPESAARDASAALLPAAPDRCQGLPSQDEVNLLLFVTLRK